MSFNNRHWPEIRSGDYLREMIDLYTTALQSFIREGMHANLHFQPESP